MPKIHTPGMAEKGLGIGPCGDGGAQATLLRKQGLFRCGMCRKVLPREVKKKPNGAFCTMRRTNRWFAKGQMAFSSINGQCFNVCNACRESGDTRYNFRVRHWLRNDTKGGGGLGYAPGISHLPGNRKKKVRKSLDTVDKAV